MAYNLLSEPILSCKLPILGTRGTEMLNVVLYFQPRIASGLQSPAHLHIAAPASVASATACSTTPSATSPQAAHLSLQRRQTHPAAIVHLK